MKKLSVKILPDVISRMPDSSGLLLGVGGVALGCGCPGEDCVGRSVKVGVGVCCVGCCWWDVGVTWVSGACASPVRSTEAGSGVAGVC